MSRNIPENIDAERLLLGNLILRPELLADIGEMSGDQFYIEAHRALFDAILKLDADAKAVDIVSLTGALPADRAPARENWSAYLAGLLADAAMPSVSIESLCDSVHRAYIKRSLVLGATQIAEIGYDSDGLATEEILPKAQTILSKVDSAPRTSGVPISEAVRELAADIEDFINNPRETFGLATGFDIDKLTGGLNVGDLVVIVGEPGKGKTALVHNIAQHVAEQDQRVRLYSFEMKRKAICMRMASNLADLNRNNIKRGKVSEADHLRLERAMGEIANLPIVITDTPCSMTQIRADVAKDARQGKCPRVVAIDYSKLLTDKGETEILRIGNITRAAKLLAMEFPITVLLIHVINSDAAKEGRMPQLRDLGWARQSQYDPDVVLATHFADNRTDYAAKIGVLKNREGEAGGVIDMIYWGDRTRWANKARQ